MKVAVLLVVFAGVALAAYEYDYKPKKHVAQCYSCAWSPPTTTYREVKTPRVVKEKVKYDDGYGGYGWKWVEKTVYDITQVAETHQGGWDKCHGPFSEAEAVANGVEAEDCHDSCYTRTEANGNIYRGCFKGAYGVDSHAFGCNQQEGDWWCFCHGHLCNHGKAHA